jgi:hypothetical protein
VMKVAIHPARPGLAGNRCREAVDIEC